MRVKKGSASTRAPMDSVTGRGCGDCKTFAPCGLQVDGREIWCGGDGVLREERLDAVAVGVFGSRTTKTNQLIVLSRQVSGGNSSREY